MRIFKNFRTLLLLLIDAAVFSVVCALIVIFNLVSAPHYCVFLAGVIGYLICVTLYISVRLIAGIYSNVWRYANIVAYFKIASSRITEALKNAVPTFRSPDEVNRTAEKSEEMMSAKG